MFNIKEELANYTPEKALLNARQGRERWEKLYGYLVRKLSEILKNTDDNDVKIKNITELIKNIKLE